MQRACTHKLVTHSSCFSTICLHTFYLKCYTVFIYTRSAFDVCNTGISTVTWLYIVYIQRVCLPTVYIGFFALYLCNTLSQRDLCRSTECFVLLWSQSNGRLLIASYHQRPWQPGGPNRMYYTNWEVSNPVIRSVAVSVHSLQRLWSYHWDQCTRSLLCVTAIPHGKYSDLASTDFSNSPWRL